MKRVLVLGLAALIATGTAQAASPKAASPKAGTKFDDWLIECEAGAGNTEKCFLAQTISVKDSGGRLIKVSVGYLGAKGEPIMVAILPLGIWLPAGAAYKIGELPQAQMVVQQCNPQGCVAATQLSKEALKALSEAKLLSFGVLPAGAQQTMTITVSSKGLKAGIEALK